MLRSPCGAMGGTSAHLMRLEPGHLVADARLGGALHDDQELLGAVGVHVQLRAGIELEQHGRRARRAGGAVKGEAHAQARGGRSELEVVEVERDACQNSFRCTVVYNDRRRASVQRVKDHGYTAVQ